MHPKHYIDREELADRPEVQVDQKQNISASKQQTVEPTKKPNSSDTDILITVDSDKRAYTRSVQYLIQNSPFLDSNATLDLLSQSYGSIPGFTDLKEHVKGLQQDIKKLIDIGIEIRQFEINGLLLYRLKFGESMHNLANQVLVNYPTIGENGRVIALFGLPGAGKSFALHALQDLNLQNLVVIDSDTSRINLFAKKLKDLELDSGSSLDYIRSKLIYTPLVELLYTTLTYIAARLRQKGYTVVQASVGVNHNSDDVYYVEHREVDPRDIPVPNDLETLDPNPEFIRAVTLLSAITESRVLGIDDYDWANAVQITDFNKMTRVTVRANSKANGFYIKEIKERLAQSVNIKTITNPEASNPDDAKKHLINQLNKILKT